MLHQLSLFDLDPRVEPDQLQPADISLEVLIEQYDVIEGPDGLVTLIKREPTPFTHAWYEQFR